MNINIFSFNLMNDFVKEAEQIEESALAGRQDDAAVAMRLMTKLASGQ